MEYHFHPSEADKIVRQMLWMKFSACITTTMTLKTKLKQIWYEDYGELSKNSFMKATPMTLGI